MKQAPLKRKTRLKAKTALKRGGPLRKQGKRGKRNAAQDAKARKALKARTPFCERCLGEGAELHHVRTKKSHPELRQMPENHAHLCRACHDWCHDHPKDARNWFRQVRPDHAEAIGIGKELEA